MTEERANVASLNVPFGVTMDSAGNLYVAEYQGRRVRKVTPDGIITTIAGNGSPVVSGDGGAATEAGLGQLPAALAIDPAGNLYIAVSGSGVVRKVAPNGIITTVAGSGRGGPLGDGGPATQANLINPIGLALDRQGNLYIADPVAFRVRRVTPEGTISTFAGGGIFVGDDRPATSAFVVPTGLAFDAEGNLLIADFSNNRIRKVSTAGIITTIGGTGQAGFLGDRGLALGATFNQPFAVATDGGGGVIICDRGNSRVRRISAGGTVTTIAGNGQYRLARDGAALDAQFRVLEGLALDSAGNLIVSERGGHRLRRIGRDGTIRVLAGNGTPGFSGDGGPALNALVNTPFGVAVDRQDNVYFADQLTLRVRKIDTRGTISTVAGNGLPGFGVATGDGGPAVQASLSVPSGIAVDADGNLYIAETSGHRIRKVNPQGIISTFAGNGQQGFSGDGVPATSTSLNAPTGLATDSAGNVYIADPGNVRVRRVAPNGMISTFAGNGRPGPSDEGGPAINAQFLNPSRIAVDPDGNVYISDQDNARVRRVDRQGLIATIAGSGQSAFAGDGGPPVRAALNLPGSLAIDRSGMLYIADQGNWRVRAVTTTPPSYSLYDYARVHGAGLGRSDGSADRASYLRGSWFAVHGDGEHGTWRRLAYRHAAQWHGSHIDRCHR